MFSRNGWLSILGWWLASASACNFIASLLLSIAFLWYPDYEAKSWHQWLVYVGIVWLAVALNTFGSQILPLFNRFNCEFFSYPVIWCLLITKSLYSHRSLLYLDSNYHHSLCL